jgi:hypothetical protein
MSTLIGYYIFLVALLLVARGVEHLRSSNRNKRLLAHSEVTTTPPEAYRPYGGASESHKEAA